VPELSPFRALRYDASAVPDISAVLCPPYDVISPGEREVLAARDPRNAVHVELPTHYEQAAATFTGWIDEGALRRDQFEMLYVYEHGDARGFFCRLRLEDYQPPGGVRPHEHTMSGPKEDRFRLMSAVKANLSPVLFLYDDGTEGQATADALNQLTGRWTPVRDEPWPPDAEGIGPGGLRNRLWLADPYQTADADRLVDLAQRNPVTIADGHHRYETALRYRDEIGGGSSDSVLALMYEAHSGGLRLLPWHRVLSGIDATHLLERASNFFSVRTRQSIAAVIAAVEATPATFGLWTRDGGAVLAPKRDLVEPLLPRGVSETLRWLDVSVLSSTLSEMIGTSTETLSADGRLTYTSDATDAVAVVASGAAEAVFLVRPTPIADVMAVAAAGEFMPAKSTFFSPKAATGLVFNPLAD
jgi:uncharacterized protein (DUF1015 family)